MGFGFSSVHAALRIALALLALGGMSLAAAVPVEAAPFHFQRQFRFGDGGGPFNADPDPCGGGQRFMREGGAGCPRNERRDWPRGNGGPRAPGSSAFGLQFDYGGY